uniref:WD repeat-containing protein 55 homolog n=1 Tax=Graphocephala atropunctata TaxID=36148 RepID=A0A1B6LR36_9HEMI
MAFSVSAKVSEEERHLSEVTCLLLHQNKLYSGADDGKVKVWSLDLKLIKEINAHPVNIYSLAASDTALYSCSNDGTVKAWSLDTMEQTSTLIDNPNNEIMRLYFTDGRLYSGDDKGNVMVWENDNKIGQYEVGEEVWDILVDGNFLFTVRNLDVSIIEMKPGGKHYTFLQSINGRSPLQKAGSRFCFMDRDGKTIHVHEISKESNFKAVTSIQAHEMIVNTLCFVDTTVFSGGYDKVVKRWDILTQQCTATAELETVINTLAATHPGSVYVGGAFGYMAKIDLQ